MKNYTKRLLVNKTTNPDGPVAAPSPAASEVKAKFQAKGSNENGASSYNQNLENGIPNVPSKANDLVFFSTWMGEIVSRPVVGTLEGHVKVVVRVSNVLRHHTKQ